MISVPLVNQWIWSRPDVYQYLNTSERPVTGWSDAPVYPINEQPESIAPYVIYTWSSSPTKQYFIQRDNITYYLWDYDMYRLMQLQAELRNYLGREDESASALRQWAIANNKASGIIDVKTIEFMGNTQYFTQTQESGIVGVGVKFSVEYLDCATNSPLV